MTVGTTLERLRAVVLHHEPELRDASFRLLTAGWDCLALDVDDRLIFKFPRHASAERSLAVEAGLLALIRPAVTMTVPDLTLFPGPPMFSRHEKIPGEHLLAAQYEALPEDARQRLAVDMALFYAQLHDLDPDRLRKTGAGPVRPWVAPDRMLERCLPLLPADLRCCAARSIAAWQDLPPDPYGATYGFFDGHGWNMAFDHHRQRLNGIYDFGDSGFGALHQEFIYSHWIARDLTARIIAEYESLTGRAIDRERVELLSSVLRLSELAALADDPGQRDWVLRTVIDWAARAAP
jgi:hypothetical protein